jgi:site-specific DNA-adenine methylase
MQPPCAYQGGKQRLASKIVNLLMIELSSGQSVSSAKFADLCCGSGAVSIELVKRGVAPSNLVMVDKGPWGIVWETVGNGTFDLGEFRKVIDQLPKDPRDIQGYVSLLSKQQVPSHKPSLAYTFLLLQASSFGSKAIWTKNNKWQNTTFRNYWEPTETSNRRSPVNPMMPMPETLFQRMEVLVSGLKGVRGASVDVSNVVLPSDCVVYVDPPYDKTTGYGHQLDTAALKKLAQRLARTIIVSEGKPLSERFVKIETEGGRRKGGISGERVEANAEYVSWIT